MVWIGANLVKNTFDKRFAIHLYFDFFRHPVYPNGSNENLIVGLELISSEKNILCGGDEAPTCKPQTFFRIDAIFDERILTQHESIIRHYVKKRHYLEDWN